MASRTSDAGADAGAGVGGGSSGGVDCEPTLLRDIATGPAARWRDSAPAQLTVVGDTTYFVAADRLNGAELWKTDGTASGTVLVKDINGGGFGSVFRG